VAAGPPGRLPGPHPLRVSLAAQVRRDFRLLLQPTSSAAQLHLLYEELGSMQEAASKIEGRAGECRGRQMRWSICRPGTVWGRSFSSLWIGFLKTSRTLGCEIPAHVEVWRVQCLLEKDAVCHCLQITDDCAEFDGRQVEQ